MEENDQRATKINFKQKEPELVKPTPVKRNPAYDHVQPKLYNATVSHDMKQAVSKGKPPTTGKT